MMICIKTFSIKSELLRAPNFIQNVEGKLNFHEFSKYFACKTVHSENLTRARDWHPIYDSENVYVLFI